MKIYPGTFCIILFNAVLHLVACDGQAGPDPWDSVRLDLNNDDNYIDAPPDLRIPLKKKSLSNINLGSGEWFFKRTLAIMLNAGQTKVNEDGSVDVSLQMKLDPDRWQLLNEYTKSDMALTEEMYRRSVAYVEEAIYTPSISEKIAMAWNEYIQSFLSEYKMHIAWCCGILAAAALTFWLWTHMSHRHVIIMIALALYLYEVVISYKIAEKQELDRFLSAVDKCSWYFWKSSCKVPPPDPIVFMKHMNPLKIGIRMFTTLLSEPMITLSATVNTMIHEITDGLWFPLNVVLHSMLIIFLNLMLIALLIMIIFNYVLNIPFNLSFLGLMSIGVEQRRRTLNFNESNNSQPVENSNRTRTAEAPRIVYICPHTQDNFKNEPVVNASTRHIPKLKRSSSTGRLPNSSSPSFYNIIPTEMHLRQRHNAIFMIGGGDSSSNNI